MDGFVASSDGVLARAGGDSAARGTRNAPESNSTHGHEGQPRSNAGNWIAAGQLGCLAMVVLMGLLKAERGGTLTAAHFIYGITALCGFAILVHFWAKRAEFAASRPIGIEILSRSVHVTALVFIATIAATEFTAASWESLNPVRTLLLILVVTAAGVAFPVAPRWLRRSVTPPCIVVFSADESAFELAQHISAEMPEAKICLYPTTQLASTSSQNEAAPIFADPKLVELSPDVAIINSTSSDLEEIDKLVAHLAPLPIDVLVHAPRSGPWGPGLMVNFANMPFVRVFPKPLQTYQRVLKRVLDMLISGVLIVLLAPLLACVAIAIKLNSRGPVLFCQPRVGIGGSHFTVYKFRTMRVEATDIRADKPTVHNDPRLTSVGAFLRKTSVDELPQLLNVLLGSMSLVGPRPHAMNGNQFSTVVGRYHARHRVKPGITGLAQVMGWRGLIDSPYKIEQRIANDLRYISEWSLLKDIAIIWRTVFAVCGRNAF